MLPMPITISAGVGQIESGQELADCIERIDQLLYRAKQEGRDQVRAVRASDR
ncbi:diguanylate cyclase [compost metagenome]